MNSKSVAMNQRHDYQQMQELSRDKQRHLKQYTLHNLMFKKIKGTLHFRAASNFSN